MIRAASVTVETASMAMTISETRRPAVGVSSGCILAGSRLVTKIVPNRPKTRTA